MNAQDQAVLDRMIGFIRDLDIPVEQTELADDTFLPGLDIRNGALLVDVEKLKYPGDILHEAGHIAVAEQERRNSANFKPTKGEEMAAMAWSFAAAKHLDLPVDCVFHGEGYQDNSENLIAAFETGEGPGVPLLVWMGLTGQKSSPAYNGQTYFPKMEKWGALIDALSRRMIINQQTCKIL